jgi:steroid delta-isomerase-like uncharacterized protein
MRHALRFLLFAATIPILLHTALITAAAQAGPFPGDPMSNSQPNSHAVVIHRFYEEVLNNHRFDLIPELVSQNVISYAPDGTPQIGIAAFEHSVKRAQSLFTGQHFTVDDVVSNGDKAAARWTMTANNTVPLAGVPPTGKQITQHAVVFYRFENGRIAETWLQLDRLGTLQQIGVQIPGLPVPPVSAAR